MHNNNLYRMRVFIYLIYIAGLTACMGTVASQSSINEVGTSDAEPVEAYCLPSDAPEAEVQHTWYGLEGIVVEPLASRPMVSERPPLSVAGPRRPEELRSRLQGRVDDFRECHRWARDQGESDEVSVELVLDIDGWGLIQEVEGASGSASLLEGCLSEQLVGWLIDPMPRRRDTVLRVALEFYAEADRPTLNTAPTTPEFRQVLPHGACLDASVPWPRDELETTIDISDDAKPRISGGRRVVIAGALDREVLTELVEHNMGAYRACYRQSHEDGEKFEGELGFQVEFNGIGHINRVIPGLLGEDAPENDAPVELEGCLAQALAELSIYPLPGYETYTLEVNLTLRDNVESEPAAAGDLPCAREIQNIEAAIEERPWIDHSVFESVEEFAAGLPSLNADNRTGRDVGIIRALCLHHVEPLVREIIFTPHRLSRKLGPDHLQELRVVADERYSWIRGLLPDLPAIGEVVFFHAQLLISMERLNEAAQTLEQARDHLLEERPRDDELLTDAHRDLAYVLAQIAVDAPEDERAAASEAAQRALRQCLAHQPDDELCMSLAERLEQE